MNKYKKIGLSALAGSLVAMSASAEVTLSGGASVTCTSTHDSDKTGYGMADSITAKYSGETDGGLTVTTSLELDGGANASSSFDNRSISISSEDMGTITFSGHGGDTVMSGWDDMMPTAYEEVFAVTKNSSGAATGAGNMTIAGQTANNTWRYDSPSVSGAQFSVAYIAADTGTTAGRISSYSDMGLKISPEAVEGLTVGYATGEYDYNASTLGLDHSTMFATYAYGSVTVGYQQSDADGPTAALCCAGSTQVFQCAYQCDVFGGSCLVRQLHFSVEENSEDMGLCFRVNERAWWNSSLNCRTYIQLHRFLLEAFLDVNC
jgi:outer membrane protein OmpU